MNARGKAEVFQKPPYRLQSPGYRAGSFGFYTGKTAARREENATTTTAVLSFVRRLPTIICTGYTVRPQGPNGLDQQTIAD